MGAGSKIRPGRWTDSHDDAVVVFLIGMTVNQWWRLDKWWPVFTAMPRMLAELSKDPASGLLGFRLLLGSRGPTVVQYWSDTESLLAYAHDTDLEHRKAWRAFNQRSRTAAGAVGIWHETYAVPAGGHETIYSNTPAMGLLAATSAAPVAGRTETASQRMSAPH
ncbi:DUF4188 domain-containing protein [Angustibacter sp. McL0619]|uniref:DUF4188 domain-containing protein n=1 Tax=Angustibacter sp. McL0619 TaxID=3415676 RepID=UPI003CF120D0